MTKFECTKSELDLFYVPPTNTSIESGLWSQYQPIVSLENNTGPIEFDIKPSPEYIHLGKTLLYLSVKFQKPKQNLFKQEGSVEEKELPLDDLPFGPVNNFASSLFSQIDVELAGKSIETTNETYPYKAYISDLLNYGDDAKNSFLQTSMFYKDTPGQMDSYEIDSETRHSKNLGLNQRKDLIKRGQGQVELLTRLYNDIFNTDRYLLNGVGLRISLTRQKPEFFLMKKETIPMDVIITKAVLLVRRVKISPHILLAHSLALEKATAKYPIKRVVISHFTISKDVMDFKTPSLASTILPQRVIVGMVDHLAFNGNFGLNPFNFQHFNLSKIDLSLDSSNIVYPNGLDCNFSSDKYLRGYYSLFEGIDRPVFMTGNGISRKDYSSGYSFFCFDLSPDLCCGDHLNIKRTGQLVLDLQFNKPREQAITLIVYSEFENLIEINSAREVFFDYK